MKPVFKPQDWVRIGRFKTQLQCRLDDIPGGWIVCPKVEGCGGWNEQAMKPWPSKRGVKP